MEAESDIRPPCRVIVSLAVIAALSVFGVMLLLPWHEFFISPRKPLSLKDILFTTDPSNIPAAASPTPFVENNAADGQNQSATSQIAATEIPHIVQQPAISTLLPEETVQVTPEPDISSSEPAATAIPDLTSPSPLPEDQAESSPSSANDVSSRPSDSRPDKVSPPLSFKLTRIEPTGESLITGQAPSEQAIQLVVNNRILSTVEADRTGLFVLTLPSFKTGGHELELRTLDRDGNISASAKALVILVKDNPSQNQASSLKAGAGTGPETQSHITDRSEQPDITRLPSSGTITVFEGENLWSIAQRVYGTGKHYKALFSANKGNIRNPNKIFPGQILIIPQPDLPDGKEPAN